MYFWLWIIILVGAIALEIVTAGNLVSIWFSAGALFGLIAFELGLNFFWQVLIFFAVSILCIVILRPIASNYLRGNIVATNADRYIGQQATLSKEITSNHWGEVNMHGVIWNVIEINGHNLKIDTLIEVVAIEGSKLIVKEVV